ncbi:MAG: nickel/cobalt transporter [Gemmataceae bacterium]
MLIRCLFIVCVWFLPLAAPWAQAHPVPRRTYDRVIVVQLTPDQVIVEYELEIDPWTVVFVAVPAVANVRELHGETDFYQAFLREYAPLIAGNLLAELDGQPLSFRCVGQKYEKPDSLHCYFTFAADWKPAERDQHAFTFREANYAYEDGRIRLSLRVDPRLAIETCSEPDAALQAKAPLDWQPGDNKRLREASATFRVPHAAGTPAITMSPPQESAAPAATPAAAWSLAALLDSPRGWGVLLVLAAFLGGAHALTPGHGKTLVAAYLVGERGTIWHALFLGLVTTITHTGAVIALAVLLLFLPNSDPADWQQALTLIGGLLVAGLGFWLLLRRLAHQADHVHVRLPVRWLPQRLRGEGPGWWNLVILGISGGIAPCWDAIFILGLSASTQRLWLALPLLLAFSAGLAGVLIAIGISVVHAKGLISTRWADARWVRALPLVSAVLITGLGLWMCYDSLHGASVPSSVPAAARR